MTGTQQAPIKRGTVLVSPTGREVVVLRVQRRDDDEDRWVVGVTAMRDAEGGPLVLHDTYSMADIRAGRLRLKEGGGKAMDEPSEVTTGAVEAAGQQEEAPPSEPEAPEAPEAPGAAAAPAQAAAPEKRPRVTPEDVSVLACRVSAAEAAEVRAAVKASGRKLNDVMHEALLAWARKAAR